jgi:hypothetical protein
MTKPIITIHDVTTNEIIEREMTEQEYSDHLLKVAEDEKNAQTEKDKLAARDAVYAKLGLTPDEVAVLLG